MTKQKPKPRVTTIAKARRRNIRDSAIGAAAIAVQRVTVARHQRDGLHVYETGSWSSSHRDRA